MGDLERFRWSDLKREARGIRVEADYNFAPNANSRKTKEPQNMDIVGQRGVIRLPKGGAGGWHNQPTCRGS